MKTVPDADELRLYGFNAYTAPYCPNTLKFLQTYGFALSDDLYFNCLKPLRHSRICHAPWPREDPQTTLYWLNHTAVTKTLDVIAQDVINALSGRVGQTIEDIRTHVPLLGFAVAGATYARTQGKIIEIRKKEQPPLYISTTLADILAA